jgi:hypothetical protein
VLFVGCGNSSTAELAPTTYRVQPCAGYPPCYEDDHGSFLALTFFAAPDRVIDLNGTLSGSFTVVPVAKSTASDPFAFRVMSLDLRATFVYGEPQTIVGSGGEIHGTADESGEGLSGSIPVTIDPVGDTLVFSVGSALQSLVGPAFSTDEPPVFNDLEMTGRIGVRSYRLFIRAEPDR